MSRAEKIYSQVLDNNFMDQAEDLFPDCNWKQAKEATEHVLSLVYSKLLLSHEKNHWDDSKLKEELFEMIFGGFT